MLVNCVVYENGHRLAEIAPEEVSRYLSRPGCFVWVALASPDDAELAAMQAQFDLHELAVEDALNGHQRPKLEEYADSLFVVLHILELSGHELHKGEVAVFVGTNFVLSVRSRAMRGFADVRARCEREPELLRLGPGFVLYALMDAVVDRYFQVIEAIENEFESVEATIFEGGLARQNIQALYRIKQRLMTVKHAVCPLRDAVGRLFGGRVPPACAATQDYFRDVNDHLERINQTLDELRESLTTAMSVSVSLIQLQENEMMKRLAASAALIAVPTLVAGIYGMNFEHMPEVRWTFGYPFAIALMLIVDAYLFYRFRKAGWL